MKSDTVGQVSQLQIRQLQEVVLPFQQAVVGLHIFMHNVQGMQLLQPLQHISLLVSDMYLTNQLSWHAWCKDITQSARTVMHPQMSQVKSGSLNSARQDWNAAFARAC